MNENGNGVREDDEDDNIEINFNVNDDEDESNVNSTRNRKKRVVADENVDVSSKTGQQDATPANVNSGESSGVSHGAISEAKLAAKEENDREEGELVTARKQDLEEGEEDEEEEEEEGEVQSSQDEFDLTAKNN